MKHLKAQIEEVLQQKPETRNSDILLTIEIWKRFYPEALIQKEDNFYVNLDSMFNLPREDHVKIIRAVFNSKGMYYPTTIQVAKQRKISEEDWRQKLGYSPTAKRY